MAATDRAPDLEPVQRLSRDLATNHIAAPMLAAWAVNAAGALIGCWFSWKAMRQ